MIPCSGALNREKVAVHTFEVSARPPVAPVTYTVNVLDENDNAPTFQDSTYYNLTLPENTMVSSGCGHWEVVRVGVVIGRR